MKCIGVLLGITVLFVCGAGAQVTQQDQSLLAWSASPSSPYGISAAAFAATTPSALSFALPGAAAAAALPLPEPAAEPQRPQGVFPDYTLDVYAGYSFVRFYAVPNATINANGLEGSVAYYFNGGWLGAEGELSGTFGTVAGKNSSLVVGGGGPRVRRSISQSVEIWAHALAGGAHFSPVTPYGSQNAFAYMIGGGIDFHPRRRRIAYRIAGDMVGSRFFGTVQYSPKISAGIVLKF